jgi:prepilin-type N-terminal cleavage/methylation domain-containing protein
MQKNLSRGFTLIELLVVIAIIGILSSVVLASLNSARQKGRDARRISDLKQIQLALELNYDQDQSYPLATSTLVTNNFISTFPSDPGAGEYDYQGIESDGTACNAQGDCASYVLWVDGLEGEKPVGAPTTDYSTSGGPDCDADGIYCVVP